MTTRIDQRSESVRLAYDRIAGEYDQQVAGDSWMRSILWSHYLSIFKPGDHVLDVSCGTGLDAVVLARHGIRITAIDISPGMIERLRSRCAGEGLNGNIDARVMDVSDLSSIPAGSFDGVISAFAGLNTLPNLHDFAREASDLLNADGRMILHLLNRFSMWEWLSLVFHGRWHAARKLDSTTERDFIIGGFSVRHYVYEPIDIYRRVFAESFVLTGVYGLGILRPPHTVHLIPRVIARGLGALDLKFGSRRLLMNRGRFFVLELVKRPVDGRRV